MPVASCHQQPSPGLPMGHLRMFREGESTEDLLKPQLGAGTDDFFLII